MIFAILLLSALFTIGECRKGTEVLAEQAVGADLTKKYTGHAAVEAGTCLISEYSNPNDGGEHPEMSRHHWECPLRTVGNYCEEAWDCDDYKCVDNKCVKSRMHWGNEVLLWDDRTWAQRRKGSEGLGLEDAVGSAGEEDAVGMKLFPGPTCVKGGTAGGVTCSGAPCHKCEYGWYQGFRYNTCCSADEARVGAKFCRCSATICKANGVDSGHCDMGKNGKTGGCDRCKRGYRTTLLGTDWCCTADDANRYADCKCTTSHTCVANGVDSGHCDTGKNGRTGGCDKCKRGYRNAWWKDWCCTSTDVNKYDDCKCSPKSEAEVAIAVAEPHDTVPVIVYGLSFMGLGVVLYGAGKYYCGKKDDMELL